MERDSAKRIYGILGFPCQHSLSPLMHNAAFAYLKINAEYKIFEKRPQDLKDFITALSQNDICGLNITVPYKEKVIPFLNTVSPEAELIGAVNTLKVSANRLAGFNTDGAGFLKHLTEDLKFNPENKNIAILGAGGASRAVSLYLAQGRPKSISIYDIDKTKLSALVAHLKGNSEGSEIKSAGSIEELHIPDADLLVNATPVGMKESDPVLVDGNLLKSDLLVYDLIYNPKETKLLKSAKEKGARISNGLGMLLYQGVLAFEIWTGQSAPIEVMRQALKEGVKI